MTDRLNPPFQPSLPLGTESYSRQYQDQFSNILRLYFNQLTNTLQQLLNTDGGKYLNFPYGAFHQDGVTALTAGISNTSTTPIPVTSTAGFPSSGYLLIGTELIGYTTTTATTFDGTVTRGALGTSQASHALGAAVSEAQATGSPTTIGSVRLTVTDESNGVYIGSPNSRIYFENNGLYNLQLSAQLLSFANSADNVTLWFSQNGVDVANSASIATVPAIHGGVPGASILTFNVLLPMVGGDYIELKWATDNGNTVIATYPAGTSPVHPVSPAVIFTATFVSSTP